MKHDIYHLDENELGHPKIVDLSSEKLVILSCLLNCQGVVKKNEYYRIIIIVIFSEMAFHKPWIAASH